MRRKVIAEILILLTGVIILAGGVAHGAVAWPELSARLRQMDVDSETISVLFIGWTFGSLAMVTMGTILIIAFAQLRRGFAGARWAVLSVGILYVFFGAGALYLRDMNPHFFFFVGLGVSAICGVVLWRANTETV